jgi:hypothetical protein
MNIKQRHDDDDNNNDAGENAGNENELKMNRTTQSGRKEKVCFNKFLFLCLTFISFSPLLWFPICIILW